MTPKDTVYGLLAEYASPENLVQAAERVHGRGYRKIDAYTPFPVHGLAEAMGYRKTGMPLLVLVGGLLGAYLGFFMQWYACVHDYPINVGGRPLNSWVAFVPITFELTVLCAGLTAVIGMLALNGLPEPYHPLFNISQFARASQSGFFLSIEATDGLFDPRETRAFLEQTGAIAVHEVPQLPDSATRPVEVGSE